MIDIPNTIKKLEEELEFLPPHNAFGDSNEDDIAELKMWIEELKSGPPYKNEDVIAYTNGDWSPIQDCI